MTDAIDAIAADLTLQEAKILAHFAAGEDLRTIAVAVRATTTDVHTAITRHTSGNRNKATNIVTAWRIRELLHEEARLLRHRLAEIDQKLNTARPARTPKRNSLPANISATAAEAPKIRAWAAGRGIYCPARGRIPYRVIFQYRQHNTQT
ncbi:histone-like nucleoid-structuring protein Lsr2 [Actinoplanes sp. NBRC 101535]|uniref:Lsr2 family DNA-binding protein n=1 Tax=Actinoplanes sp. NBRC 101535 TaxID=3032196 RepID=UPI0024A4E246|nr:histone-like nucleoid-structuring protein Lsr2 [Actinoplanes sp. NBRC 101535]GLY08296.1 hypothetical protein Acsp01_86750 [Actinoplanes sp. NBRC 101535]